MLNHKYFISAFSISGFAVLSRLNSTKIREFDMVGDYVLEPVRLVYPLEALLHVFNVNEVVEQELTSAGRDLYQIVVPQLEASATSGFDSSSIFFTDGSKGGASAGFGEYHYGGPESSFRLREPSVVFTSAMSAIFVVLIQIRARRPGRQLTVTGSMRPCRFYMKSKKLVGG
jgi:hypothetical protein